jgi:hypothetical protein
LIIIIIFVKEYYETPHYVFFHHFIKFSVLVPSIFLIIPDSSNQLQSVNNVKNQILQPWNKTKLYKLEHIKIITILRAFDSEPSGSEHYTKLIYT